jgi:hypothetical protein
MAFLIREAEPTDSHDVATVHVLSWQAAYLNIIPDEYLLRLDIEKRAERFAKDFITWIIRKRFDDDLIAYLLELKWWDWPAHKIFDNLEALCNGNVTKIQEIK